MNRVVGFLTIVVALTGTFVPSAVLAQTNPVPNSGGRNGTSVAANDKSVYVVRGNTLYKFNASNLALVGRANFPATRRTRSVKTTWPRSAKSRSIKSRSSRNASAKRSYLAPLRDGTYRVRESPLPP